MAVANRLFAHAREMVGNGDEAFEEQSGSHYSAYFLAGCAIENAVKAVMIGRDPEIITDDGKIDRKKFKSSGHAIKDMVANVLDELEPEDVTLLSKLEHYVTWAGKYTVPLDGQDIYDRDVKTLLRMTNSDEKERLAKLFQLLNNLAIENGNSA